MGLLLLRRTSVKNVTLIRLETFFTEVLLSESKSIGKIVYYGMPCALKCFITMTEWDSACILHHYQ